MLPSQAGGSVCQAMITHVGSLPPCLLHSVSVSICPHHFVILVSTAFPCNIYLCIYCKIAIFLVVRAVWAHCKIFRD